MSYWVSATDNGRALATAAVRHLIPVAFAELGLHRIKAETCCITREPSACWNATGLSGSGWRRPISRSPVSGRTTF